MEPESQQPVTAPGSKEKPFGEEAVRILQSALWVDDDISSEVTEFATFAGGCFWGLELSFQRVPGVLSTTAGYMGGFADSPTYHEVKLGVTGHLEVVQLTYDPQIINYSNLLDVFWDRHNPFTGRRQGNDVGPQYNPAIFYHTEAQKVVAEEYINQKQRRHIETITTMLLPAGQLWHAEEYHQQYLEKKGQSAEKGDITAIRCYG